MSTICRCNLCGAGHEIDALFCPHCGSTLGGANARAITLPADPIIGREIIGQYIILQKLGEGGMGSVYLADQRSVGRRAVVKVMHPELTRDPSVAQRFAIEAKAASLLNHPHIITIYNYGAMEDGTLFLAMEHCAGCSLDGVLSRSALDSSRAALIGAQICDALAEAHRHGIVHRDLKPSNIMLVEVGRQRDFVKVLDFGIAKVEGTRMTRTGNIIGTPQYMSPEQLRGESLDGRSDLYSLGVLLYEMITGKMVFEAENTAGFMHKHLSEAPVPPRTRVPQLQISNGLEAVIMRALAKEPADRFHDADEMGRALEGCVNAPELPFPPAGQARQKSHRGLWFGLGGRDCRGCRRFRCAGLYF
jgi:eukaryotic-like serine/threonine-protein kinase